MQRECVLEQARRLGARAPLHTVAAEGRVRLWREADVAHDGDTRIDERANLRHHTLTSLELDRVRSSLLDKPHAVARRVLCREVRAKGEVAYEQRAARARGRGTAVVHHLVHSHLGRVLAPEHHHAHRVPHEQHVHARAVGDARARVVIGGHHADRLLARVLEAQLVQVELGRRRCGPGHGRRAIWRWRWLLWRERLGCRLLREQCVTGGAATVESECGLGVAGGALGGDATEGKLRRAPVRNGQNRRIRSPFHAQRAAEAQEGCEL